MHAVSKENIKFNYHVNLYLAEMTCSTILNNSLNKSIFIIVTKEAHHKVTVAVMG